MSRLDIKAQDNGAYLVLALHGHLPWVNHPEHEFFLEEDWLFEGIADCYLPLLMMLDGFERDGIPAAFTLGLSPPLLNMFAEENLCDRASRYLKARSTLLDRFLKGLPDDSPFRPAAEHALAEVQAGSERYHAAGRDLPRAFAHHHDAGRLELMTCGATHGLMPVLLDEGSIEAQVHEAIKAHERFCGVRPRGIWLPECGVTPLAFPVLAKAGLIYCFVEDRAIRLAEPPPVADVYRPLYTPQGVACFGRDPIAAKEVWSADEGYPGDPRYREFYRDLGYDADEALLDPVHKEGTGGRKQNGIKLHRITGRVSLDDKKPYEPWAAEEACQTHARHFTERRIAQTQGLRDKGVDPVFVATFDGELFGHWWHEGPRFLELALRQLATRDDGNCPRPVTALQYLNAQPRQQVARPAVSSWGDAGAFKVWANEKNDWLWRKVYDARLRLKQHAGYTEHDKRGLAVKQAAREVMLAQSSDWPFIITMGTQDGYAAKRPVVHLSRAHRIMDMIESGEWNDADLEQIKARDGVFPDIDPTAFA